MITRANRMQEIATTIADLINSVNPRACIVISYVKPTETSIEMYSDFQRRYHGILTGQEYFMLYKDGDLLYTVNITADSYLTAAEELMHKVAAKF